MNAAVDVLIVGAGPVGLMLAAELQRRGVDHLLIEEKPAPAYFVKPCLYLIRPDGYVGYRSAPADRGRLRRHLVRVLAPRPAPR